MSPNWTNIAIRVKIIPPILLPTDRLRDHTTDSQITKAATGIRKKSEKTNASGTLGIENQLARTNSRK
jgi:hypothetical protein